MNENTAKKLFRLSMLCFGLANGFVSILLIIGVFTVEEEIPTSAWVGLAFFMLLTVVPLWVWNRSKNWFKPATQS